MPSRDCPFLPSPDTTKNSEVTEYTAPKEQLKERPTALRNKGTADTLISPRAAPFSLSYHHHHHHQQQPAYHSLGRFNMPGNIIIHDDESTSSGTSFSTAYESIKLPPRQLQLRRRNTVTTLKRWVSKRVSRASLNDGNELSEKNLTSLDQATRSLEADNSISTSDQLSLEKIAEGNGLAKITASFQEVAETLPDHDLQRSRDPYLLREYDAFCHEFTLSGAPRTKRNFDLSMEMGREEQATNALSTNKPCTNDFVDSHLAEGSQATDGYLNYEPSIAHTSSIESQVANTVPQAQSPALPRAGQPPAFDDEPKNVAQGKYFTVSSTYQPQPPSQVITPLVYMEMQRATRERRLSRRQSLWRPLRSMFSSESLHRQYV